MILVLHCTASVGVAAPVRRAWVLRVAHLHPTLPVRRRPWRRSRAGAPAVVLWRCCLFFVLNERRRYIHSSHVALHITVLPPPSPPTSPRPPRLASPPTRPPRFPLADLTTSSHFILDNNAHRRMRAARQRAAGHSDRSGRTTRHTAADREETTAHIQTTLLLPDR